MEINSGMIGHLDSNIFKRMRLNLDMDWSKKGIVTLYKLKDVQGTVQSSQSDSWPLLSVVAAEFCWKPWIDKVCIRHQYLQLLKHPENAIQTILHLINTYKPLDR